MRRNQGWPLILVCRQKQKETVWPSKSPDVLFTEIEGGHKEEKRANVPPSDAISAKGGEASLNFAAPRGALKDRREAEPSRSGATSAHSERNKQLALIKGGECLQATGGKKISLIQKEYADGDKKKTNKG